jgi:prepilin-type N-terminal cleavage/methylation domain-containing protein
LKISLRKFDRGANANVAKEPRKGFVIVEVIVAMVLLAVAVSSLAALMYSVSQSGMKATSDAYRNGVLMQEANRLEGVPYDSVYTGTFTTPPVTGSAFPHTTVISVSEPLLQVQKNVTVIITPVNTKFKPDTMSFVRTKARTSKVLCTTCQ